jgi:two-component system LytT family sensor kinase
MKKTSKKIIQSILFQHIIFWGILIFSFFLLIFGISGFNLSIFLPVRLLSFFITVFYIAVAVYVNLLFLIPRFLKKKKYISFAFIQMLNIIVFIFLNFFTSVMIEREILKSIDFITEFAFEFLLITMFISITTFLKLLRDWINYQDDSIKFKETQRQKLEAELKLLRGQINPHFLFNTLNNLYALSLDKSDKTPDLILRLSDLMRYMLYDCRDSYVIIEKEISFIKNYLELEKIRIGEKANIEMNVIGNTHSLHISPLLFIPFIENAFKHGTNRQINHSFIKITFDFEKQGYVKFIIENTKDEKEHLIDKKYSGIGIDNVKKRLLLLYPEKYKLKIADNHTVFRVELIIEL